MRSDISERARDAIEAGTSLAKSVKRRLGDDHLRQQLDDIRERVAALASDLGEEAAATGNEGYRQARQVAAEVKDEVVERANGSVTALRNRVEEVPLASLAIAFCAGVAVSGLVMSTVFAARPSRRD